ncbi:hypothetical protein [Streptomyces longwoodensis]|uniref:hypothetical protein n=1 Tax=Streptomyces longwoodensis TaxID=68231 RepID=UPI000AA5B8A4|nr:hypothetical protein [Streptomyces longwoodensis]
MRSTVVRARGLRRLAAVATVGATLTALSGCTVPVDAVAGLSVTADGHLLGVVLVCGHHIDGATVYVAGSDPDREATVGEWTASHPLTEGVTTWPLDTPSAGWTTTTPLRPLAARTTYVLYGWTKDNSWSSTSVEFTLRDRAALRPGTVLYDRVTEDGESTVTVPMTEFKSTACTGD